MKALFLPLNCRGLSTIRLHHPMVVDQLLSRIEKAYTSVKVGSPLEEDTLVGPLVDRASFDAMQKALADAREQGGEVKGGERVDVGHADAYYVRPAIVRMWWATRRCLRIHI